MNGKYNQNPALVYASAKKAGYESGQLSVARDGMAAGSAFTFAGFYNANLKAGFLTDEQFAILARDGEAVAKEIFTEQVNYARDVQGEEHGDMMARLRVYVNDVREKCGLEPFTDEEWGC